MFAALAHPARLRIMLELSDHGPLSAGELTKRLKAEQSALSHQLTVLRKAAMVKSEVQGRSRLYSLADHHVAHIVGDALAHARER